MTTMTMMETASLTRKQPKVAPRQPKGLLAFLFLLISVAVFAEDPTIPSWADGYSQENTAPDFTAGETIQFELSPFVLEINFDAKWPQDLKVVSTIRDLETGRSNVRAGEVVAPAYFNRAYSQLPVYRATGSTKIGNFMWSSILDYKTPSLSPVSEAGFARQDRDEDMKNRGYAKVTTAKEFDRLRNLEDPSQTREFRIRNGEAGSLDGWIVFDSSFAQSIEVLVRFAKDIGGQYYHLTIPDARSSNFGFSWVIDDKSGQRTQTRIFF